MFSSLCRVCFFVLLMDKLIFWRNPGLCNKKYFFQVWVAHSYIRCNIKVTIKCTEPLSHLSGGCIHMILLWFDPFSSVLFLGQNLKIVQYLSVTDLNIYHQTWTKYLSAVRGVHLMVITSGGKRMDLYLLYIPY